MLKVAKGATTVVATGGPPVGFFFKATGGPPVATVKREPF
jgi:hypothetical protein